MLPHSRRLPFGSVDKVWHAPLPRTPLEVQISFRLERKPRVGIASRREKRRDKSEHGEKEEDDDG